MCDSVADDVLLAVALTSVPVLLADALLVVVVVCDRVADDVLLANALRVVVVV